MVYKWPDIVIFKIVKLSSDKTFSMWRQIFGFIYIFKNIWKVEIGCFVKFSLLLLILNDTVISYLILFVAQGFITIKCESIAVMGPP